MKRETIRTNQNLPRNHQESTIIKQSCCLPGRFWSVPFFNVMNKVSISQIILIYLSRIHLQPIRTHQKSTRTRNYGRSLAGFCWVLSVSWWITGRLWLVPGGFYRTLWFAWNSISWFDYKNKMTAPIKKLQNISVMRSKTFGTQF